MKNVIVDEDTGRLLFAGDEQDMEELLTDFAGVLPDLVGASQAVLQSIQDIPTAKRLQLLMWAGKSLVELEKILSVEAHEEEN
jgi:hypothetical protein